MSALPQPTHDRNQNRGPQPLPVPFSEVRELLTSSHRYVDGPAKCRNGPGGERPIQNKVCVQVQIETVLTGTLWLDGPIPGGWLDTTDGLCLWCIGGDVEVWTGQMCSHAIRNLDCVAFDCAGGGD